MRFSYKNGCKSLICSRFVYYQNVKNFLNGNLFLCNFD